MNYEGVWADLRSSRSGQRLVVCGVGWVLAKNHTKVVFFLDICKFFSNFVPDF